MRQIFPGPSAFARRYEAPARARRATKPNLPRPNGLRAPREYRRIAPGRTRRARGLNALALWWLDLKAEARRLWAAGAEGVGPDPDPRAMAAAVAAERAVRDELWLRLQGQIVKLALPHVREMNAASGTGGMRLEDLCSLGQVGASRALSHFDPTRGAFTTCAYWWIRQAIYRGLADEGWLIAVPQHAYVAARAATEGMPADAAAVAAERAMRVEYGLDGRRRRGRPAGDALLVDRSAADPAEEALERVARAERDASPETAALRAALARVADPRAAAILRRRLALDGGPVATLGELAAEWGISRERVRQIARTAGETVLYALSGRPGVRPGLTYRDLELAAAG